MDLNLISKQIQFMPDAQLAQSVKNPNGVMPSYLALAELNRRQKIRSSAPQQEPQGTVADEVLQSLHSAGVQPQQPMQQGAPMPQQMGIAQAPGMYAGGLVGYAGGGEVDGEDEDDDADLQEEDNSSSEPAPANAGIARQAANVDPLFDPLQVQRIEFNPKQTSIKDAAEAMRSLYGQGADTGEEMNGIRQLRGSLHQPTQQDLSRLQGLYTMASKDPMGGLAAASLQAHKDWDEQQQQYYGDMMKSYGTTYAMKKDSQQRVDHIADAIKDYWHADNAMNMQSALGNLKATSDTAKYQLDAQKALEKMLQASNPTQLNELAARAQGHLNDPDPAVAARADQVYKAATAAIQLGQQQQKDKQAAELEKAKQIQGMRTDGQMRVADHKFELNQKLSKTGLTEDGQIDWNNPLSQSAAIAAEADFNMGKDPVLPRNMPKEAAAAYMNAYYTRKAQLGTGDDFAKNNLEFHGNKTAIGKVAGLEATTGSSEKALDKQIPYIQKSAEQVKHTTGYTALDEKIINGQAAMGNSAAKDIKNKMETFAWEYARLQTGGVPSDSSRAASNSMFMAALNKGQLKDLFEWVRTEAKTRTDAYSDEKKEIVDRAGKVHGSKPGPPAPKPAPAAQTASGTTDLKHMSTEDLLKQLSK